MQRRPRRKATDLGTLEAELASLKEQEAELKRRIRQMRGGNSGIRRLQEKLEKQLAGAKWTVQQIHELQSGWDDLGFYQTVRAVQPTPRGRRLRQPAS